MGSEAESTGFPWMGLVSHAASSYQALRNTADPFDSIRTPHPRTIVEIHEVSTQTEDAPYFSPPLLDIVPYRPIQIHRPVPHIREADVMDVNGVIRGEAWVVLERPEVDIEPPSREQGLIIGPIQSDDDSVPMEPNPVNPSYPRPPPRSPAPYRQERPHGMARVYRPGSEHYSRLGRS